MADCSVGRGSSLFGTGECIKSVAIEDALRMAFAHSATARRSSTSSSGPILTFSLIASANRIVCSRACSVLMNHRCSSSDGSWSVTCERNARVSCNASDV